MLHVPPHPDDVRLFERQIKEACDFIQKELGVSLSTTIAKGFCTDEAIPAPKPIDVKPWKDANK